MVNIYKYTTFLQDFQMTVVPDVEGHKIIAKILDTKYSSFECCQMSINKKHYFKD